MKRYKVYCIRDKQGNIVYIGQTKQPLPDRRKGHHLRHIGPLELIADFDTPEPMYELERMLIAQYGLLDNGLNKSPGYFKVPKPFDQSGESNSFYGQKHGPATIEKLRQNSLGNSNAKGNKSRSGQTNSPEHQAKIDEARQKPVMCVNTGEVYKSGADAAKKLGLQKSKICNVCKGKRGSTGGLRFVYVEKVNDKSG